MYSRCISKFSWPCGDIWHRWFRSMLVQVMACCLMAPSHYMNQCWITINQVLWHSFQSNRWFKIWILKVSIPNFCLTFSHLKSQPHLPGANKRLSKHSRSRWFETPSHSLWCHCNVTPNKLWQVYKCTERHPYISIVKQEMCLAAVIFILANTIFTGMPL